MNDYVPNPWRDFPLTSKRTSAGRPSEPIAAPVSHRIDTAHADGTTPADKPSVSASRAAEPTGAPAGISLAGTTAAAGITGAVRFRPSSSAALPGQPELARGAAPEVGGAEGRVSALLDPAYLASLHIEDLVRHVQAVSDETDARTAKLHADIAMHERRERAFRLWLHQRTEELRRRERQCAELQLTLKAQARRLAVVG